MALYHTMERNFPQYFWAKKIACHVTPFWSIHTSAKQGLNNLQKIFFLRSKFFTINVYKLHFCVMYSWTI